MDIFLLNMRDSGVADIADGYYMEVESAPIEGLEMFWTAVGFHEYVHEAPVVDIFGPKVRRSFGRDSCICGQEAF